jgi:LPXTG-site transpeptidase (sortase) family protein
LGIILHIVSKKHRQMVKKSKSDSIGGQWLPHLLIWGGVLLMLIGGVMAYPVIQSYLMPPDVHSLEFRVTPVLSPAVVAVQPTPQPTVEVEPAQQPTACPAGMCQGEEENAEQTFATATAPPPIILPETELLADQETPTATQEPADEQVTPEATLEPTPTPLPTPTLDPASLIPTRLLIPAINLDTPILSVGWETQEIAGQMVSSWIVPDSFAAGWHKTSALPGNPGNIVLNGHHNIHGEVFRDLEDLQPGDEIVINTGNAPHYYAVAERHILEEKYQTVEVRQQNAQFIMPTADERLTMVTCWPYTNNTHRLIIVALPIEPTLTPTPMIE